MEKFTPRLKLSAQGKTDIPNKSDMNDTAKTLYNSYKLVKHAYEFI